MQLKMVATLTLTIRTHTKQLQPVLADRETMLTGNSLEKEIHIFFAFEVFSFAASMANDQVLVSFRMRQS